MISKAYIFRGLIDDLTSLVFRASAGSMKGTTSFLSPQSSVSAHGTASFSASITGFGLPRQFLVPSVFPFYLKKTEFRSQYSCTTLFFLPQASKVIVTFIRLRGAVLTLFPIHLFDESRAQAAQERLKELDDVICLHTDEIKKTSSQVVQLERRILDFYYQHEAHCESSDQVSAGSLPAYYRQSDMSRLLREKAEVGLRCREAYAASADRVQQLEKAVEEDIVLGSLAAQKSQLDAEEAGLKGLEGELRDTEAGLQQVQHAIHHEEERQLQLLEQRRACQAKRRRLEEQKQRQMDNVDSLKKDLEGSKNMLQRAKAEFQQRQLNIQHLREIIVQRETQNKRRAQKQA
eukprot:gene7237-5086_t